MPRYLARVELRDATSSDYARLNDFMVSVTFETSMVGDNGRRYVLPSAEYFLETDRDLQAVRSLVEHVLEAIGRDHVFIVVEITSAAWSLHER
jgi:hypothetical protein